MERQYIAYSFARCVHGLFHPYLYCIGNFLLQNHFETLNSNVLGENKLSLT